jgi:phosphate transport system protein
MIETAQRMLSDVLQAYRRLDLEKAVAVWHADEELDRMYTRLLEEVRLVLEKDDARFRAATGLIFLGRCCERIGDHVKNLAENVHFIVTGTVYAGHPAE